MTETTTPLTAEAVANYVRFWNTDPSELRRSGGQIFSEDIIWVTPIGVTSGIEGLARFVEQFTEHVGAYEFRARTEPDVHHDRARVPWELRVGDASFAEGTDVLTATGDGRIMSVTGFLDRAPDGFDPADH
ncbi:nuclear transport factor 2 family protein [Nocardioides sp. DS6]|uniref:Nuclear transport factor 2 family protein n=1 Tax=Nocardioides eburneus TaxID=3231482 RepID=A0ABV3SZX0_9ACTN